MQKNPAERKTRFQYKVDISTQKHGRDAVSKPYLEVVFDEYCRVYNPQDHIFRIVKKPATQGFKFNKAYTTGNWLNLGIKEEHKLVTTELDIIMESPFKATYPTAEQYRLKLATETLSEDNIGWNSILAAFQNYFTLNGSLFSQLQNLRGLVYDSLTYQALLVRTMLLIYGHPRRNTVMPRSKFPLFNFYNTGTTKLLSNPVSKGHSKFTQSFTFGNYESNGTSIKKDLLFSISSLEL